MSNDSAYLRETALRFAHTDLYGERRDATAIIKEAEIYLAFLTASASQSPAAAPADQPHDER